MPSSKATAFTSTQPPIKPDLSPGAPHDQTRQLRKNQQRGSQAQCPETLRADPCPPQARQMDRRPQHQGHRPSQNTLCLKIHCYNRQKALPISRSALRKSVCLLLEYLDIETDELSVYFVSSKKIAALHQQFFNDPSPTDCITFPIDSSFLGEIFVCPEVALLYASERGLDPYEETLLYLVHGLLHLAGFDDLSPNQKRAMRKKEKSCMRQLKNHEIILSQ